MTTEEERIRERLRSADEARDWVESMLGIRRNTSEGMAEGVMHGKDMMMHRMDKKDKIRQLLERSEELKEQENRIAEMYQQLLGTEREEGNGMRLRMKDEMDRMMKHLSRA